MQKKSFSILVVLMMLAASALACNTVMGGGVPSQQDLQATADALENGDANATIEAAQATADALNPDNGNDNGNDSGDDTGDDNSNDNSGDVGDTENPFGQGPADIPVLDDNAELLLGDDTTLTYYTDASFDDTVQFYRDEMPNNGWDASANGDNVFGEIASLQYEQDSRQALIAITVDPTSDRTLVAVTITNQ